MRDGHWFVVGEDLEEHKVCVSHDHTLSSPRSPKSHRTLQLDTQVFTMMISTYNVKIGSQTAWKFHFFLRFHLIIIALIL